MPTPLARRGSELSDGSPLLEAGVQKRRSGVSNAESDGFVGEKIRLRCRAERNHCQPGYQKLKPWPECVGHMTSQECTVGLPVVSSPLSKFRRPSPQNASSELKAWIPAYPKVDL